MGDGSLATQEMLCICEIPPECGSLHQRWDFWWDHPSASPTRLMGSLWRSCSASWQVFYRGNWSICNHRCGVSLGGGEFRISLHCHLEPNTSAILTLNDQWNNLMFLLKYLSKTDVPEIPTTSYTQVGSQGCLYLYRLTHILLLLGSCSFLFYWCMLSI